MSEAPAILSTAGPPHGVHLIAYATICADIAEGDRPQGVILAAHGLTDAQWTEVVVFWSRRMADDAEDRGPDAKVALVFSDAFAQAQDRKKAPTPLTVEDWAALTEEMSRSEAPERCLAARRMSTADYLRSSRYWAQALATDAELNEQFEAAREAWIVAYDDPELG